MTSAPTPFLTRLKTGTQDLHDAAERHPFQKSLASGALSKDDYARFLAQMLVVHRALASALRATAPSNPPISAVWREHYDRQDDLTADLAFLGRSSDGTDTAPATNAFIAMIGTLRTSAPHALLGILYVLEGSTNGGRFIAKGLRRALNLTGTDATRFLDPYGERQRELWAQFKADLEAAGLSPAQQDEAFDAARATFAAISAMSSDLSAPVAAG